ncbi:MAG: trypsin-like peptidase domain-containing protein [Bacilli bacterium]
MRKKVVYIVTVILSLFLGAGGLYGIMYFFPNSVVETINKEQVTVTDEGISKGVKKVYDSVVVIECYSSGKLISTGTGFVYKKDNGKGYIMTNHHVIDGAKEVKVTFTNEKQSTAKVVGSDEYADIAVITVDDNDVLSVASIGNNEKANIGDTVFTIGAPMGKQYAGTVTRGILSGKNRLVSVAVGNSASSDWIMAVMQTDAAINPGNSGGPLCNVNGEVLGINSLKIVKDEIEGVGFSIPIEDALKFATLIENGKEVTRPYIGIEMIGVDQVYVLMQEGIKVDPNLTAGVVVINTTKDSPSEKAGLKRGDVIVKVSETEVSTVAEFRYYLYKFNPGDKVSISVYRDGKLQELKVTLGKSE